MNIFFEQSNKFTHLAPLGLQHKMLADMHCDFVVRGKTREQAVDFLRNVYGPHITVESPIAPIPSFLQVTV